MNHFFSEALEQLGFQQFIIKGLEVIVPPIAIIPASTFTMGSNSQDGSRVVETEFPQHEVFVETFYLAFYPVTVAEYACAVRAKAVKAITRGTPHTQLHWEEQLEHLTHPVVGVRWKEALTYTSWLTHVMDTSWRLPTEAEWEKAARGNDKRIYPWGNYWDALKTNNIEHLIQKGISPMKYPRGLVPIGIFKKNVSPLGIYEMVGGIQEWCSSLFRPYPYDPQDGREDLKTKDLHVLRGAPWTLPAQDLRLASRNIDSNDLELSTVGFRLAQTITL